MVATPKGKSTEIDPFDIYVGRRLGEARMGAAESREQLAARWGITFQQVQKYEKGLNRLSHRRIYDASIFYDQPLTYFTEGYSEEGAATIAEHPALDARMARGSFRVAQLYNMLTDDRLKAAVLALLHSLLAETKGKRNGK